MTIRPSSRYGVDDEDEEDDEDDDAEEDKLESFLLDQYKIRAKLDVLKDDVQAVIPITKVSFCPWFWVYIFLCLLAFMHVRTKKILPLFLLA